jgi:hypothetical protein
VNYAPDRERRDGPAGALFLERDELGGSHAHTARYEWSRGTGATCGHVAAAASLGPCIPRRLTPAAGGAVEVKLVDLDRGQDTVLVQLLALAAT